MTPIEYQILRNQQTIMRNLAFGFKDLRKDGILNSSLLKRAEETTKLLNPITEEELKK